MGNRLLAIANIASRLGKGAGGSGPLVRHSTLNPILYFNFIPHNKLDLKND